MAARKSGKDASSVRLIAGKYRRRRLPVAPVAGLRPTPDRVRETVFNWIAGRLPRARCLDLFAGSGALGFEAASRGAADVTLVEQDRRVVAQLRDVASLLADAPVEIEQADVLAWLQRGCRGDPYDVVFVDPPYHAGLLAPVCHALRAGGWLSPDGVLYLESREALEGVGPELLPDGWAFTRTGKAGQVRYYLASQEAKQGAKARHS